MANDRVVSPTPGVRRRDHAWARPLIFLALLVVLWDLIVRLFDIPPYLIPKPWDVALAFRDEGGRLMLEAIPTTIATLGGFALSVIFGVGTAMLIAGFKPVESYVYPLLVFSQSIPKVAVAPLFVVWFGGLDVRPPGGDVALPAAFVSAAAEQHEDEQGAQHGQHLGQAAHVQFGRRRPRPTFRQQRAELRISVTQ